MKKTLCLSALLLMASHSVMALETPHPGIFDQRVKFIDYNPFNVVKLVGNFGFSTHIQFADGEKVEQIAIGDKDAWEVAPVENHIFIKPKGEKAYTNMTVITAYRVYNFDLSARPQSEVRPSTNELYFQINFRYPDDELKKAQQLAEAKKLKDKINTDKAPTPHNWNYWAKGSLEVSPNSAFDDGQFTYFKFANNREMPAIYIVNSDGSESLVNTNIDPTRSDTIAVHRISKQFVLRKGKAVACVFNKSYDPDGIANTTGTMSPGVTRVIKGQQ